MKLQPDGVVADAGFAEGGRALGPVDNYLRQTIMQVMQIMDMKAWAVLS